VKIISKVETIYVNLDSTARLYEKAINTATMLACTRFDIDDCGHSGRVEEWSRGDSTIRLRQISMEASGGMMGWSYNFVFEAWCEKCDENGE